MLAGTRFCLYNHFRNRPNRNKSQSYSCWYSVLSQSTLAEKTEYGQSQSYSCWYWVLSYRILNDGFTVERLNPILAGTGFCPDRFAALKIAANSLNPILAGTGFCQFKLQQKTGNENSLNPILAGTGFCLVTPCGLSRFLVSQSSSYWYWVLCVGIACIRRSFLGVSILFLLVLGSV